MCKYVEFFARYMPNEDFALVYKGFTISLSTGPLWSSILFNGHLLVVVPKIALVVCKSRSRINVI